MGISLRRYCLNISCRFTNSFTKSNRVIIYNTCQTKFQFFFRRLLDFHNQNTQDVVFMHHFVRLDFSGACGTYATSDHSSSGHLFALASFSSLKSQHNTVFPL